MDKTIRSFIRRRVRGLAAAGFSGWLLFALAGVWSSGTAKGHPPTVVMICGFVLFGGAILVLQLWVTCPKCSRRLGQTIAMSVAFAGKKAANYCPFCGVSLDEPLPPAQSPAETLTTPDKLPWK